MRVTFLLFVVMTSTIVMCFEKFGDDTRAREEVGCGGVVYES